MEGRRLAAFLLPIIRRDPRADRHVAGAMRIHFARGLV
jgi:hypothetical protein